MMIVRVRSNVGTWRVKVSDDKEHTATVGDIQRQLLQEHPHILEHYRYSKTLSLDSDLAFPLDLTTPLKKQGIANGAMLYCRLEEEGALSSPLSATASTTAPPSTPISAVATTTALTTTTTTQQHQYSLLQAQAKNSEIEIVDLLDCSSSDDDDDNDSVVLVSLPLNKAKAASEKKPPPRKRPRSTSPTTNSASASVQKKSAQHSSNSNPPPPPLSNFQMATYNVWFGPPDPTAGQVYPQERMTAIVECIQQAACCRRRASMSNPLLFIGFQELTPSLVGYLKPLLNQQLGYKLCTQPLGDMAGASSYGIGVAVPQELEIVQHRFVPYSNTRQGRGLLYVQTPTLLLATTHLESWTGPQSDGSKEREVQMVDAALFCKSQLDASPSLKMAAILGDLNWDDERKQKRSEAPNKNLLSLLPTGWKDAGEPFDYTYDAKENPMLGGNLRRRFDRCIYYAKNFECSKLEKIGTEAIPGLVWQKRNPYTGSTKPAAVAPSDHFGVVFSFGKAK